ncbi:hypothetical protein PFNF54_00132 [Plasmodium falciparum NF54]|uniref:J domain-containing protein n=1 Tax=Plasmodium falciparum (isolate NF54) TaxID=5843 RepID=W7K1J2_PLAFO|nr:hypothetical protein PFNF54_00132 [Plasmodium falciparum NF54]
MEDLGNKNKNKIHFISVSLMNCLSHIFFYKTNSFHLSLREPVPYANRTYNRILYSTEKKKVNRREQIRTQREPQKSNYKASMKNYLKCVKSAPYIDDAKYGALISEEEEREMKMIKKMELEELEKRDELMEKRRLRRIERMKKKEEEKRIKEEEERIKEEEKRIKEEEERIKEEEKRLKEEEERRLKEEEERRLKEEEERRLKEEEKERLKMLEEDKLYKEREEQKKNKLNVEEEVVTFERLKSKKMDEKEDTVVEKKENVEDQKDTEEVREEASEDKGDIEEVGKEEASEDKEDTEEVKEQEEPEIGTDIEEENKEKYIKKLDVQDTLYEINVLNGEDITSFLENKNKIIQNEGEEDDDDDEDDEDDEDGEDGKGVYINIVNNVPGNIWNDTIYDDNYNNNTYSSAEEYIFYEKKLDDNTRNNMKRSYYDILDVKEDSDINEIKRKFYNLSLKYYPKMNKDKNLVMNQKFENISEAYQILGYENRRKLYDLGEYDETNKMIIIDPLIFFNLIFTSDMMYEYTGNTQVSTFVKLFFEKNISVEDISYYVGEIMKEMMEGQNIREEKVAELLKDRLDLYIDNEDEWKKLMENEISMLLKSSFSSFILESIGWTYENVSNIFLEEKANSGKNKKDIYLKEANERIIRNSIVLRQCKSRFISIITNYYPFKEQNNPFIKQAQYVSSSNYVLDDIINNIDYRIF